jgi:hypothetical protein
MKQVTINLYEFKELSTEAKTKAISQHEDFLLSVGQQVEENGELVTVYSDTIEQDDVIDSIEANEYLFFFNGELAHTCQYVDNHPTKAGVFEFIFKGQTIEI